MRELEISCPTCGSVKNIKIPKELFTQKKSGCIKVQVPFGAVCSTHQFVVFFDQNGLIRGYEKLDIIMTTPLKERKKKI